MFTVTQTSPTEVRLSCECGWFATLPGSDKEVRDMAQRHVKQRHSPNIEQLSFQDFLLKPVSEYGRFKWDGKDRIMEMDEGWG